MNRRSTALKRELAALIQQSETLMNNAAELKIRADALRREVDSRVGKKAPSKKRGQPPT